MAAKKIIIEKHDLIPLHEKLSAEDKKKLFDDMNINFKDLPKVKFNDSALVNMDVKVGDVIKISRPSATSKETVFYRGVTDA